MITIINYILVIYMILLQKVKNMYKKIIGEIE